MRINVVRSRDVIAEMVCAHAHALSLCTNSKPACIHYVQGRAEETDHLRRELAAKDDVVASLENENRKLKDRVRELSQLTDMSIQASQSSMHALKEEVCLCCCTTIK